MKNIEQILGLAKIQKEEGEDYRLKHSGVLRIDTNQHIPERPGNAQWKRYLWWISEGNRPKPIIDELNDE